MRIPELENQISMALTSLWSFRSPAVCLLFIFCFECLPHGTEDKIENETGLTPKISTFVTYIPMISPDTNELFQVFK